MPSAHDRDLLRRLAGRVREIADDDSMPQRRQRWKDLNSLRSHRPMVVAFPEGAWRELIPRETLECEDDSLHGIEMNLRQTIYWWDVHRDDKAIDPWFSMGWVVSNDGYGVELPRIHVEELGAYTWDPPIKDVSTDMAQLHFRNWQVDREATQRNMDRIHDLFGDLLPPRIRGRGWWSLGLTATAAFMIGLENLMMWMFDRPDDLHRLMAFLRDDAINTIEWWEREALFAPHDAADYNGSGGLAYTDELPQPDHEEGEPIRLIDVWGFAESQETVGVGPDQFAEFILPYQAPILQKFGLNYYGCCEPIDNRFDRLKEHVPRLRALSVSPWSDVDVMAEKLGRDYVYCRKPNPAPLSVGFNEKVLREDLQNTLRAAGNLNLAMIMKDTHTIQNEPERLTKWLAMAYEEVDRHMEQQPAAV